MVADDEYRSQKIPRTREERLFLQLIREGAMPLFVGGANQLGDDELLSLFAVAKVAIRRCAAQEKADRSAGTNHPGLSRPQRPLGSGEPIKRNSQPNDPKTPSPGPQQN